TQGWHQGQLLPLRHLSAHLRSRPGRLQSHETLTSHHHPLATATKRTFLWPPPKPSKLPPSSTAFPMAPSRNSRSKITATPIGAQKTNTVTSTPESPASIPPI